MNKKQMFEKFKDEAYIIDAKLYTETRSCMHVQGFADPIRGRALMMLLATAHDKKPSKKVQALLINLEYELRGEKTKSARKLRNEAITRLYGRIRGLPLAERIATVPASEITPARGLAARNYVGKK